MHVCMYLSIYPTPLAFWHSATSVTAASPAVIPPPVEQTPVPTTTTAAGADALAAKRRALIGELRVRLGDTTSAPSSPPSAAVLTPQPAGSASAAGAGGNNGAFSPQASGGAGDDEKEIGMHIQSLESSDKEIIKMTTSAAADKLPTETPIMPTGITAASAIIPPARNMSFMKPLSSFRMVRMPMV